jgi:hypothetical protein
MRNGIIRKVTIATMLAFTLVVGAGCTEWLLATGAGSFTVGYLLGTNNADGQVTCYRNGEVVDCSTLPANIAP